MPNTLIENKSPKGAPVSLKTNNTSKVKDEIKKISQFYNLKKDITFTLNQLEQYFSDYLEVVLTEKGFEIIIGGIGEARAKILAKIANNNGLPKEITNYFLLCCAKFKDANLGLKLCFGDDASLPSLYVRTKTTTEEGVNFLENIPVIQKSLPYLIDKLSDNKVLYGIGFSARDRRMVIKTYTIGEIPDNIFSKEKTRGFISYRIVGDELQEEIKRYLPDSVLENFEAPDTQWEKIKNFIINQLNIDVAGHIGLINYKNKKEQYKIYLERIGAIPTDFKAR